MVGEPSYDHDHGGYRVVMRNRDGGAVSLVLDDELVDHAYDGIAVMDVVERSLGLSMLAGVTDERTIRLTEDATLIPVYP